MKNVIVNRIYFNTSSREAYSRGGLLSDVLFHLFGLQIDGTISGRGGPYTWQLTLVVALLFFGGREATTGNTSAVHRLR